MDFKISYAITACNEHDELTELLALVAQHKRPLDEIVVQVDSTSVTDKVKDVLMRFDGVLDASTSFPLNNDFANFKNNLKEHCSGDYIFQLEADEVPSKEIIENLHQILQANPEVDLFLVPRVNTIEGYNEGHSEKWNWQINKEGWVNWPDFQDRIFKNRFNIKWENSADQRITGAQTAVKFPEATEYALLKNVSPKIDQLTIDYAILTHNEGEYIENLLSLLTKNKRSQDNIIIVDDYSDNEDTKAIFNKYRTKINLSYREFDNEEGQRNHLKSLCKSDYIFVFDADELMTEEFITNLPKLLACNPKTEMFYIPRINTVEGLTDAHIEKWKWNVNEKGWINFPDYQTRLHKNLPHITWKGFVHSTLSGFRNHIALPHDEVFCMIHKKEIKRQESQNDQYDKIEQNGRTQYKV